MSDIQTSLILGACIFSWITFPTLAVMVSFAIRYPELGRGEGGSHAEGMRIDPSHVPYYEPDPEDYKP